MKLRARNIKRRKDRDLLIDLDYIFHEEDPLVEWVREQENSILDDKDTEWLDDTLQEEAAIESQVPITGSQVRESGKKRRKSYDSGSDDSAGEGEAVGPSSSWHDTGFWADIAYDQEGDQDYQGHRGQMDIEHSRVGLHNGHDVTDSLSWSQSNIVDGYGSYGTYGTKHVRDYTSSETYGVQKQQKR